jgi:hypothetical protein
LTVDGVDFFGTRDDSWRLLPPVQLAVAGLESIRWATCGALARLPVAGGERINLHVNASIAYLSFPPSRRSAVVLFPALLAAWEGFARQLHVWLLNQLPELRDHRVYSWFRGDPLAFDPAFRPPPTWPTA